MWYLPIPDEVTECDHSVAYFLCNWYSDIKYPMIHKIIIAGGKKKKKLEGWLTSPTSPSIRLVFYNVIIPWSPCVPRGIFHYQLTRPATAALIYVEIWMHEIFRACPCLVQTVSYIIVTRIQGSSMHPSPSSTSSLQALWVEESTPRGPLCSLKQLEDWSK